MTQRLVQPDHLVALGKIPSMEGIALTDDSIRIGAMCTHRSVETSPVLQKTAPLLGETYRHVATQKIRNMATVGGGLVHADPNLDPPPSLIALGATVVLASATGRRSLPVEEFFLDYYDTALQPGEILTEVLIPQKPAKSGGSFFKFLPRTADDYATVSAAAFLSLGPDGGTCAEVRIGLGSVGMTPIRARKAEEVLRGRPLTSELLRRAGEAVEDEVDPMEDFRGSAGYKTQMAQVFARRALEQALQQAQNGPL